MDILLLILSVCSLAVFADAQNLREGPCFDFQGESYLHFTPNNFDNDNAIHYTLKFRTTAQHGIIMYARGRHGDDEALYIRNGRLYYHLFNTSPSGVEGYFGGFYEGSEDVNTGDWVTVHLYRMWEKMDPQQRRLRRQTGFVVEIGEHKYQHLDYIDRSDISILPTIYFGGYREELSDTVTRFVGQIKDIREEKNGLVFENPSLNYMSKVRLECDENPTPV